MMFLPLEKLPAIILGPLLMIAGICGLCADNLSAWDMAQAGALVAGGLLGFIFGTKEMLAEPTAEETAERARRWTANTLDSTPDFSRYSATQLRHILTKINRERYPERVAEIEQRLAAIDANRV